MVDPARCETHGVVLTPSGVCVLCARRGAERASGSAVGKLFAVAGTLILLAAGYRAYLAVSERGSERARAEPATAPLTTAPLSTTTAPPSTTTLATTATATAEATAAPATRSTAAEVREESLAHQRRLVDAQRSVTIDLYGEGWCPSCRKARAWLDAQGIAYTYRDTSDSGNKRTMRALNPQSTIPTINVDGRILVGFSARNIQNAIDSAAQARAAR